MDFSCIVKTDEELEIENKHCWHTHEPPLICFNNCFSKEYVNDPNNWKNVYPEYYWLDRNKKIIESRLKKNPNDEKLKRRLSKCNQKLIQLAFAPAIGVPDYLPTNLSPLSTTSATLLATGPAPGINDAAC